MHARVGHQRSLEQINVAVDVPQVPKPGPVSPLPNNGLPAPPPGGVHVNIPGVCALLCSSMKRKTVLCRPTL